MKWVIVGSYEDHEYGYGGYTGNSNWVEKKIATFDRKEDAERYIKDSKLKNPMDRYPFRQKSLLSGFQYAEIEEFLPETLPHNSKL